MLPSMDDSILIKSINYSIDALRHYLIIFFAMLKSWWEILSTSMMRSMMKVHQILDRMRK